MYILYGFTSKNFNFSEEKKKCWQIGSHAIYN